MNPKPDTPVSIDYAWIASTNSDSVSTEIARTLLREIQRLETVLRLYAASPAIK